MTPHIDLPPIPEAPHDAAVAAAEAEYRRWRGVDAAKARRLHREWVKAKAESLLKQEEQ